MSLPDPRATPQRVRVTRTRRRISSGPKPSLREEVDAQSGLGAAYVGSLERAQRRLSLRVIAALVATLGLAPLAFLWWPGLRTAAVAGIPLPWLLMGALVYPAVIAVALWYTRTSERLDEEFTTVVDPP